MEMQASRIRGNLEPLRTVIEEPYTSFAKKAIEEEIERLTASYSDEELEIITQALLDRQMGMSVSPSSQIFLPVVIAEAKVRCSFVVSASTCVSDLVLELVERFKLPMIGPKGQAIQYQLVMRKKTGGYCVLLPRPTLYQQEVETGCELVLFPVVDS